MTLYCDEVMTRYVATRTRCPISVNVVMWLTIAVRMFAGICPCMNTIPSESTRFPRVRRHHPYALVALRSTLKPLIWL